MSRYVVDRNGRVYDTPLFLPVFQRGNPYVEMTTLRTAFPTRGLITNAFFLYKDRPAREAALKAGVRALLDYDGLVVTDSGAFQGFQRPLYLSNRAIIEFQERIGADVISPLDLVSPPGERRTVVAKKLDATIRRVEEGLRIVSSAMLIGVQQGGRFADLRLEAARALKELGCRYVALGSLVPFFNRAHDVAFVGTVIRQARSVLGDDVPIHLFGAGDPVELPVYVLLGCDVFDSSSFAHYAGDGWYMTPFGSFDDAKRLGESGFVCACPYCVGGAETVFANREKLALHNLWTIFDVVIRLASCLESGTLNDYVEDVVERNRRWFPESRLAASWATLR